MLAALLVLALAADPSASSSAADLPAPQTGAPSRRNTRLRRRSIALGVTAGIFGLTWIGLKGAATASSVFVAGEFESGALKSGDCVERCDSGPLWNLLSGPILLTTTGLLGGSMHAHGRRLAHERRGLGRSRRHGTALVRVGAGLLGAGLVTIGLGIGGQWLTHRPLHAVASREVGWWGGAALGTTGAALLGLGDGIVRGHRERERRATVAVAPMLGAGLAGLSIGGRF